MRFLKMLKLSFFKVLLQGKNRIDLIGKNLYGELMTVNINGRKVKMRHHSSGKENAPVYIDIHGGGWAWGSIENGDELIHNYVEQLGCEAYSLDYTLVPFATYPTQYEQLYETIKYMSEHAEQFHIDPEKIIIGGRSAGGSSTASLALMARDRGDFKVLCQCIEYPLLDLTMTMIPDKSRYQEAPALPIWVLRLLANCFAAKKQQKELYCSPLLADVSQLKGLPPAIIMTCELDSVRYDGELYAEKLKLAGADVTYWFNPGKLHGFDEEKTQDALEAQQYFIDNMSRYL